MRKFLIAALLMFQTVVYAHPGRLSDCRGHTSEEWVAYPPMSNGSPTVPSEPGEYHFHFTSDQMDEVIMSLSKYRKTNPRVTPLGIDHGSFFIGGIRYDIFEYTRQGEAIIHCAAGDILHTGIARIRVSE